MNNKFAVLAVAGWCLAFATNAQAFDRREVIRAGEKLAEEVEHLDETLHDIKAPKHITEKIHHFEETVIEFVDEVRGGCSYQFAQDEMKHIRQDMRAIRSEFSAHPHLLHYPSVRTEYRMMRRAYRWLDHAMYMHHWNRGMDAVVEADIVALEQHAENR